MLLFIQLANGRGLMEKMEIKNMKFDSGYRALDRFMERCESATLFDLVKYLVGEGAEGKGV